jgi:hypothetical protein
MELPAVPENDVTDKNGVGGGILIEWLVFHVWK